MWQHMFVHYFLLFFGPSIFEMGKAQWTTSGEALSSKQICGREELHSCTPSCSELLSNRINIAKGMSRRRISWLRRKVLDNHAFFSWNPIIPALWQRCQLALKQLLLNIKGMNESRGADDKPCSNAQLSNFEVKEAFNSKNDLQQLEGASQFSR